MIKYFFGNRLIKEKNHFIYYDAHQDKAYMIPNQESRKVELYRNRYLFSLMVGVMIGAFFPKLTTFGYVAAILFIIYYDLFMKNKFLNKFTVLSKYDYNKIIRYYDRYSKGKISVLLLAYVALVILLGVFAYTNYLESKYFEASLASVVLLVLLAKTAFVFQDFLLVFKKK